METSDRQRFDAGMAKLLNARSGRYNLSPADFDPYWHMVKREPLPAVLAAMTDALEGTGHLSPSDLRNLIEPDRMGEARKARNAESSRLRSQEDAEAERKGIARFGAALWASEDFQAMKRKANVAYSKRLVGMAPEATAFTGGKYHEYNGGFDYTQCVMAAPLPRDASSLAQHQRAWEEFWRILREEYEGWEAQK